MKMKHLLSAAVATLLSLQAGIVCAQGIAINTSGSAADTSAMLDITSTSKGILVPRMSNLNRGNIVTPATGLLIYQTDGTTGFYYNSGTPSSPTWTYIGTPAGSAGGDLSSSYPNPTINTSSASTGANVISAINNATSATINAARLNSSVTTQGNTFNGASELVQMTSATKLPAVDGSNLTSLNASNLSSGTVGTARLGSGTASGTTYLRGDQSWATIPASGATLELIATQTASSVTVGTTSTITVVFNSVATSPSIGSYNSSTGTYTAGASGTYLISASYGGTANVNCQPSIVVGGTTIAYGASLNSGNFTTNLSRGTVTTVASLSSGSTVTISVFNTSSASSQTLSTDGTCRFTITKL